MEIMGWNKLTVTMKNKKGKENEFVYLATAPNQIIAEIWVDMLKQEGIASYFRSGNVMAYTGLSFTPCQVMVIKSRLAEAADLIASIGEN